MFYNRRRITVGILPSQGLDSAKAGERMTPLFSSSGLDGNAMLPALNCKQIGINGLVKEV